VWHEDDPEFVGAGSGETPAFVAEGIEQRGRQLRGDQREGGIDDVEAAVGEFGGEPLGVGLLALEGGTVAGRPQLLHGGQRARDAGTAAGAGERRLRGGLEIRRVDREGIQEAFVTGQKAAGGDGRLAHLVWIDRHRVDGGVGEVPVVVGKG